MSIERAAGMETKRSYKKVSPAVLLFAVAAMAWLAQGCGDVSVKTEQLNTAKNSPVDLSAQAPKIDTGWHTSYLEGAHSGFICTDCHVSVARTNFREISGDQICARCHMDAYNRAGLFNHAAFKADTHCNSCHFSDSFRSHSRLQHSAYHGSISGSCESCHTGKTPASHANGRTANCASCHMYPTWSASGGGAHSYTSGCVNCHSAKTPAQHKNDGRTANCESCHKYPAWTSVSGGGGTHSHTSGCVNCHSAKTPSKHKKDGRTANCELCHKYPSWKNASFNHSGVTSGCASCHTKHYSGYACEACHTAGISWRYKHSGVRNDGCTACHGSGKSKDGDGKDGEKEGGKS